MVLPSPSNPADQQPAEAMQSGSIYLHFPAFEVREIREDFA